MRNALLTVFAAILSTPACTDGAELSPQPGWRFRVRRRLVIDLKTHGKDGTQSPLQAIDQTVECIHEVKKVADGRATQALRTISKAERLTRAQTKDVACHTIAPTGTVVRVFLPPRKKVTSEATGERVDGDLAEAVGRPLAPDRWPRQPLAAGMSWSYEGYNMMKRMPFDCFGGKIALKVESVAPDPATGLVVAKIRGRLQTKVEPADEPLTFLADVTFDVPVAIGVPMTSRFEGTLSGKAGVTGTGCFLQYAMPSLAIVRAAGGRPPAGK